MVWSELYTQNKEPSIDDIKKFINNKLWGELNEFIQNTYNVEPSLSYSCCSGQPRLECKI